MQIELTEEEWTMIVQSLQQKAMVETTVALNQGHSKLVAHQYANLAEKVRQQGGQH